MSIVTDGWLWCGILRQVRMQWRELYRTPWNLSVLKLLSSTFLRTGLRRPDVFLLARGQEEAPLELMLANMASPGRLDAFRVTMAMIAERKAHDKVSSCDNIFSGPELPPTVKVLYRFMDAYNSKYAEWKLEMADFRNVKGEFFEVACRYGIELLWHRIGAGADSLQWRHGTVIHRRPSDTLQYEEFTNHFPAYYHESTTNTLAAAGMFAPDTLWYPV